MAMRAARRIRDVREGRQDVGPSLSALPGSARSNGQASRSPSEPKAPHTAPAANEDRAKGAEPTSAEPTSAEPKSAEPKSAEPKSAEPKSAKGAEPKGAESKVESKREPKSAEPRSPPAIPLALIDRDALDVVRRLRRYGYSAYLVGGCVRDLLIGLKPKDFDVSTNARPEQIRRVFNNCRIVGRRFRLAHVYFRGGKVIETSTFRASAEAAEEEGGDLLIRHDNVFGTELEDALRRDFTINALFYDVASGMVVDHVGGMEDLRARRLRMIGDPEIRLREDPVRILRAVRIAAKTNFEIEASLEEAMNRHKGDIHRCPKPRVSEELLKLFRSGHAVPSFLGLERTNVLDSVLPRLAAFVREEAKRASVMGLLGALDVRVAKGSVTDPVVLACLVAPFVGGRPGPRELLAELEELLAELGATKRASERIRHIFLAQRHFQAAGRAGRRNAGPEGLARRSYFLEALDLHEIRTIAAGGSVAELEALRATARLQESDADDDELSARPQRRRRRRR